MTKRMLFAPSGLQTDGRKKLGDVLFSFTGTAQTRVSSLEILGKTDASVTPSFSSPPAMLSLGEKSVGNDLHLAVSLHGRNRIEGAKMSAAFVEKIPSGTYTVDNRNIYFSIPGATNAVLVDSSLLRFKKKTSYTARIYMINTSGHTDCVQLAWLYSDGSEDPWVNPVKNYTYNLYVATSDPGKDVVGIKHYYTSSEEFMLSTVRFGIFEGVTVYDDFTDYHGNVYPISLSAPLRGFQSGGVFVADKVNAVTGTITRKIRDAKIDRNSLSLLSGNVYRIPLSAHASLACRDLLSNVFTPVKTLAEVGAAAHRAALSPAGDAIYLSAASGENAQTLINKLASSESRLLYVLKTPAAEQNAPITFSVPRESDEIEILAATDPYRTELLLTT